MKRRIRRGFNTRKGRPKSQLHGKDLGTPELIRKRMENATAEMIDSLLEKQLISPAQHKSALRFRWLYTLRYGTATISAMDMETDKGRMTMPYDPKWRQEREQEYKEACNLLNKQHCLSAVLQVAVLGEAQTQGSLSHSSQATLTGFALQLCRKGLDIL
ncbi:MAG: hypothetical protein ACPG80_03505, partial [Rickettsiales bacterium]